jgi:hypothetical protein
MTFTFIKTVLTSCRYAMCISFGVLSVSGTASATLIESIAALEEGAMYRVLFVTRDTEYALTSNIEPYNTFVSNAAVSGSVTGGLGLTWKALASTGDMNAQVNTGIFNYDSSVITMFNTAGQIVASSGSDLWSGTLDHPVGYDEHGEAWNTYAWTGTNDNGETYDPLGGIEVRAGDTMKSSGWWTRRLRVDAVVKSPIGNGDWFYDVGDELSLYAVSSVVVMPLTDVPEPGTVILLSLGLAGLSFARYRKQY